MHRIEVFDAQLNRLGVIQTWISLTWREGYNAEGNFQLEVQAGGNDAELLKPWNYCALSGQDTVMVIRSAQLANNRIVAYGAAAVWVLEKRVSTAVVANQNAEEAMRGLVNDMTPWPCVELGAAAGITEVFENQISDGTVLKYLKDIGAAVDIGFRLRRSGKKLLFECYKPDVNENAKYSDRYGNIKDPAYTINDQFAANVAIVAGAGEGEARITVEAGATGAAGTDRLELYVDARGETKADGESDAAYRARLVRVGQQKLLDNQRTETLRFDVQDDRARLGDLIPVWLSAIGIRATVRVIAVEIVSQKNRISRSIALGTPTIIR